MPVFSHTRLNDTSKLSPLGTASPACLAKPMFGIYNGVGSSVVPLSPGAPALGPEGSEPLSESSVAVIGLPVLSVIGLPLTSTAAPLAVTVFSNTPVACAASISTLNWKTNESPTTSNDGIAVSTISVALLPFQTAVSSVTVLDGSAGGVTMVKPLAFT